MPVALLLAAGALGLLARLYGPPKPKPGELSPAELAHFRKLLGITLH
jgi:hypothetical protein